jgi:long-subunit acyl-CoA synthetase (AMP-forming)
MGEVFRLSKFVESLIVVARRVFAKLKQVDNEEQCENEQKVLVRTLLEYMEAVKSTNTKKTKFMHERFCFILLDEHPEQVLMKTIQVKDKVIREPIDDLKFINLMEKLEL